MAGKKNAITQRSLNALETKNKLFSTALMLFTQHGFDKVTVDDITRFAGVSKGTFYNYFGTKDEVLVEQYNQIDKYYEQAFRQVKEDEPAPQRLLLFADTMCNYCCNVWGINLIKIVYINQISLGKHPDILLNKNRAFYKILTDTILRGRSDGVFTDRMPVEDQVYMFARGSRSALYEWCLYNGGIDLKETCRAIFQQLMDNLRPERAALQKQP